MGGFIQPAPSRSSRRRRDSPPGQRVGRRRARQIGAWKIPRSGGRGQALAEHWNGAKWVRVRFRGLRRLSRSGRDSARDVWMVGTNSSGAAVILHWDGERWTRTRRPNAELLDLVVLSRTDVWAVGDTSAGRFLELHWDGSHWASYTQRAPNGGYGPDESPELTSVVESGSRDIWAAGDAATRASRTTGHRALPLGRKRWRKAVPAPRGWIYALAYAPPATSGWPAASGTAMHIPGRSSNADSDPSGGTSTLATARSTG